MAAIGGGFGGSASHADYDFLLKIIMVGDSGVGKSALLKSFMGEAFTKHYVSTIGVDFEIKQVMMSDHKVHLQIWDTAGQERFRTITTSYYRSSDAILLVFDVTEQSSFDNIEAWLENVREYARQDVDLMLVGNKVDLEDLRVVDYNTAKAYADENYIPYIETSAKTNYCVNQAFNTVALAALKEKINEKKRVGKGGSSTVTSATSTASSVSLSESTSDNSGGGGGCC